MYALGVHLNVAMTRTVPFHLAMPPSHIQAQVLEDLKRIYERFASAEEVTGAVMQEENGAGEADREDGADGGADGAQQKAGVFGSDNDSENEEEDGHMSKKKLRMARQLKVAELKKVWERMLWIMSHTRYMFGHLTSTYSTHSYS